MSTSIADPTALGGYQLCLPGFEGPLDVLLRLIERDQLAITDVSLVAVTDQFLAHLRGMDEAPASTAAEFAAIGGRLVLLKSRSLLPRPAATEDDEPEDLVRQLAEYRELRAAAHHLATRDRLEMGAFARGEGVALPDAPPPRLVAEQAGALARALRRRLTAAPSPRAVVATRTLVTLREMTERLLSALPGRSALRFGGFRAGCADRHEVLVAFLAVLVLVRRRVIEAEQIGLFGEITLRRAAPSPVAHSPIGEAADD